MNDDSIKLDQFLKFQDAAETGGQAKLLVQGGFVKVNGEVETRRGRRLKFGDEVEVEGKLYRVESDEDDPAEGESAPR